MITCQECEAEFEIVHDNISEPEYCPFCGFRLRYDDDEDSQDWDDQDRESF